MLGGLYHFTINDAQGRRYDREGLVEWTKNRFGAELSLEDLKSKQRAEIEQTMFEQSRITSQRVPEIYSELRERLDTLMRACDVDPVTLRQEAALHIKEANAGKVGAGSKFAARSVAKKSSKYTGKYATLKSTAVIEKTGPEFKLKPGNASPGEPMRTRPGRVKVIIGAASVIPNPSKTSNPSVLKNPPTGAGNAAPPLTK